MSRLSKPDVQIVVTIPERCDKDAVEAMRAVCDGVLALMLASEYFRDREGPHNYGGYTAHRFTRTVRFEVEAPPAPRPAALEDAPREPKEES